MEKINNVQVEIDNDKYRLFVDGVEIKKILNLKINRLCFKGYIIIFL